MYQLSKWKQPNLSGSRFDRGVCHLNKPKKCSFSCSTAPLISKISEISNQKRDFPISGTPFGVATAPLEFTQIVKEVKLIAQARNLRIHQYLDDWLLRSPTKRTVSHRFPKHGKIGTRTGWLISFQKSELVPTKKLDF